MSKLQREMREPIVFEEELWGDISDEAKEFIKKMIQPNPELRKSAQELLQDQWIEVNID